MKLPKALTTGALSIIAMFSACSTPPNIVGKWVGSTNEQGTDTLQFFNDGTFAESLSQRVKMQDSGFDICYGVSAKLRGRWRIDGDSLYATYDTSAVQITFADSLFSITPSHQGADLQALEQLKDEMKANLYKGVETSMKSAYLQMSESDSPLGKVSVSASGILQIENNGATLTLHPLKFEI